jgi:hypothetical protein
MSHVVVLLTFARAALRRTVAAGTAALVAAAALTVVAQSPAAAVAWPIDRVNVTSTGAEATFPGDGFGGAMSSDGRFVAFRSGAPNLVPGDTNDVFDVFVRDRLLGQTTRVSVGPGGAQSNAVSTAHQISADGRYVAFQSSASNLVPGDTNGVDDVFVHDRQTGTTTRVSVGPGGAQATQTVYGPDVSADGRFVTMTSSATELVAGDTNGQSDVFVHDRQTGTTTRVSVNATGGQDSQFHGYASISDDGRWVAYHTFVPFAGGQLYLWLHDRNAGTSVQVAPSLFAGVGSGNEPSLSSEGRFVAFESDASTLVPGDTNGVRDIFVYDRQTATTTRVSTDSAGGQANATSSYPRISGNGRFVTFASSASNLRPNDTNGYQDVFVHDRVSGTTQWVNEGPGGQANAHSQTGDISSDGRFVSFVSSGQFVLQKGNNSFDVFVSDRGPQAAGAPVVSLDAVPASRSNDKTPTFEFSSSETADFQCSLTSGASPGPMSACTSPFTASELTDGSYVFAVKGYNQAGTDRRTVSFVIDTVGPNVTLTQTAASVSSNRNPRFSFLTETGAVTECSLSTGADAYVPCTSPVQYSELADGAYTFKVRSTDVAGNVGEPKVHAFTVDTVGPSLTLDEGPSARSNDSTPTFRFTTETGATTECVMQPGTTGFAPCTSPVTYQALADGDYYFSVLARDRAGNLGDVRNVSFSIDTLAPAVTITAAPPTRSNDTTPTFSFSSETGASFECSLTDDGTTDYVACSSPRTYDEQPEGEYVFKVRATDAAGNAGAPAEHSLSIDRTGPSTTIDESPAALSQDSTPSFAFSSEPGATFSCSLSRGADSFAPCTSPLSYSAHIDGDYMFKVRATDAAGNTGSVAQRAFTIDTSGPETAIDEAPAALTTDATPGFSFSSEAGASFQCSLGSTGAADDFEACESPRTFGEQPDGDYTFKVRATDAAGNTGLVKQRTFTIDTSGPETEIDEAPTAVSADATPGFSFSSEAGASFECSLSTGLDNFAPCTSPKDYTGQTDGNYVFKVRATDAAGNTGSVSQRTFTIDTSGPDTTIDEAPSAASGDTTPTFAFSSEAGATFECSMSTGEDSFVPCESPRTYEEQPGGDYVFKVRATDAAGNTGPVSQRTFTIDTSGPETTIDEAPSAASGDRTPTFGFSSEARASFECSLTGQGEADDFNVCESPRTYGEQPDGDYVFKVRATDGAGNTGPVAQHAFAIDTSGPETAIDEAPSPTSNDTTPTFAFSSEAGATFECSMSTDEDNFVRCESPRTYDEQPGGDYVFKVRATDAAGNTGPVSQRTFTIDTSGAETAIDEAPAAVSADATPGFSFSSEAGANFECSLSTGLDNFAPCTSPKEYTGQQDGDYTFKVRAIDASGNAGPVAEHVFTIDTSAPETTITQAPTASSADTTPTFAFTSGPGVTFECSLTRAGDPADFTACTSPRTYGEQPEGGHVFSVRATDAAGNTGPAAQHAFTIATQATSTACSTATNVLNGTDGSNALRGTAGHDRIDARAGNDTVTALRGNDCVLGGTGADSLKGNAGDDELVGGDQDDRLAGGLGRDLLVGGNGVDYLYAVDDEVDQIQCGSGANEIAVVDPIDVVVGCERVRVR